VSSTNNGGYVYIGSSANLDKELSDMACDDLRPPVLKIGRTKRTTEERFKELNGIATEATKNQAPAPYAGQRDWICRFKVKVSNVYRAEAAAQQPGSRSG
jgi:hypothetical protein